MFQFRRKRKSDLLSVTDFYSFPLGLCLQIPSYHLRSICWTLLANLITDCQEFCWKFFSGKTTFNASYDMRKDVLFFLLIMLTTVANKDLAATVKEKEREPKCCLKLWEVTLLNHKPLQLHLKSLPADVKITPAYKSELKSTSNEIARQKRKPDFWDEILLPKKAARAVDQTVQKVNIDIEVLGGEAHDDVNPISGPLENSRVW